MTLGELLNLSDLTFLICVEATQERGVQGELPRDHRGSVVGGNPRKTNTKVNTVPACPLPALVTDSGIRYTSGLPSLGPEPGE